MVFVLIESIVGMTLANGVVLKPTNSFAFVRISFRHVRFDIQQRGFIEDIYILYNQPVARDLK